MVINEVTSSRESEREDSPHLFYELQSPLQFRDDFVAAVRAAGPDDQVAFETMQFEVCAETEPLFEALTEAKKRKVKDVRFHYDRVAREHIRDPEDGAQAWFRPDTLGGLAIYSAKGDEKRLKEAFRKREQVIADFEAAGIANPSDKKRGEHKILSHNHVKLAIVGNVAWFGSMNQRAVDYEWSNFMIKVTDPQIVSALKYVFEQTEKAELGHDKILLGQDESMSDGTQLLLDVGERGQSVIYNKAVELVDSLKPGDKLTMIGQWPPIRSMYGEFAKKIQHKMKQGAAGTFLLSPEEHLHPMRLGAKIAKKRTDKMVAAHPGMAVVHLPQQTHAKAIFIERADGKKEALIGSHNFTSWTVLNGTRELAMYTQDPTITNQIESFLTEVQAYDAKNTPASTIATRGMRKLVNRR